MKAEGFSDEEITDEKLTMQLQRNFIQLISGGKNERNETNTNHL